MSDPTEDKINEAVRNPRNMGEMQDADAVGTVGGADCGDMVRMWLKFGEKEGKKVIDRASFQSFGCQTAIAVASVATEMLAGKTVEEALDLSADDLSEPLGPLPPMKIHCGQMVEGALRDALAGEDESKPAVADTSAAAPGLVDQLKAPQPGKIKIVKLDEDP